MKPGLCGYDNETVFIDGPTLVEAAPTFVGMPVYIGHQKVDLENIKEQAAGYVSESFFNQNDGWFWVKFIAIDDAAHEAIKKGWGVSNAYIPTESGPSGTHNNIPYTREITQALYTHLAIVPDPRYEQACVFTPEAYRLYQNETRVRLNELINSKTNEPTNGGKKMSFNLFKTKREAVTTVDEDTMIELQNGKTVKVADMVAALEAQADAEEKQNAINAATVVVKGQKMTVAELAEKYNAMCDEKTNEDTDAGKDGDDGEENGKDEDEKTNGDLNPDMTADMMNSDEGDEKKNAEDEADEDAKDEEDEKTNALAPLPMNKVDHFAELKNAHRNAPAAVNVDTSMDMMARGKQRYGSTPATKH